MKIQAGIAICIAPVLLCACGSTTPQEPTPTPITIVETVEVTRQVIVTATPIPPTPLAEPIFQDDFETDNGEWQQWEIPEESIRIEDGELVFKVHAPNWISYAYHPEFLMLDNYTLDADITFHSGPGESEAGIAFRCSPSGEEWIQFTFDSNGYFTLVAAYFGENEEVNSTVIVPYTMSQAIYRGQKPNHVRLIDSKREFSIFINDSLITKIPYDWSPSGCPNFVTTTYDAPEAMWSFDNVVVRPYQP